MKTLGFQGFHWRRGWDSNPCAIARKLISSQPRYDHFDTSPYMLTRHTEINAIFSCIRIPVRTGIVLETMECPKPAWLKGFRRFGFRLAKKISSQPRYVLLRCPKFFARCSLRKISTAATPFCSLLPPQAAVANVPTSIRLHLC